jgi:hypothetical protein
MRLLRAVLPALLLSTAGCHSPYIEATVSNRTSEPMKLIEVDYPSASFGTQTLAPGQDFRYRFQVLGQGRMKLIYTDSANHEHKFEGPELKEGAEGPLTILVDREGTHWNLNLR